MNVGNKPQFMNGLPVCDRKCSSDCLHHLHCLHNSDRVSWCKRQVTCTAVADCLRATVPFFLPCTSEHSCRQECAAGCRPLLGTGVLASVCIARCSCSAVPLRAFRTLRCAYETSPSVRPCACKQYTTRRFEYNQELWDVTLRHADVSEQPGASIFRVNQSGFLFYSFTLKMESEMWHCVMQTFRHNLVPPSSVSISPDSYFTPLPWRWSLRCDTASCRRFGTTWCLHLQGQSVQILILLLYPEDGGTRNCRNVGPLPAT